MFLNGYQEGVAQCPVLQDPGWAVQCPMGNQWIQQQTNQYNYSRFKNYIYPMRGLSQQCYGGVFYQDRVQGYATQIRPVQEQLVPNLPCNQRNQQWDYNSMCYNVDGQPCQYTNVVDLEDFM